jgi:hypothetical protein
VTNGKRGHPREVFPGFYSANSEELHDVWHDGLVVLDSGVLLSLYKLSTDSRDELLKAIEAVGDRLWISSQALFEFESNRLKVIEAQRELYRSMRAELEAVPRKLVGNLGRHPMIKPKDLQHKVRESLENVMAFLERLEADHPNPLQDSDPYGADSVRDAVAALCAGHIGPTREVASITHEGARRYAAEIPPGYKDKQKDESKRYGDLIIWFDMLDLAERECKPILFVTDDQKDDWWRRDRGKLLGPRPELVNEMHVRARQRFHLASLESFLREAKVRLDSKIAEAAIEEVARLENYEPLIETMTTDRPSGITIDFADAPEGPFDKRFFEDHGLVFTEGSFVGFLQGHNALVGPVAADASETFTTISVTIAPGLQGTATYLLAAYEQGKQLGYISKSVTQDEGVATPVPWGYVPLELGPLPRGADSFAVTNMFIGSSFPDQRHVEFGVASIALSS